MDFIRSYFDEFYDLIKHPVFYITKKDAEVAHNSFLLFSKILSLTKLEKLILDNKENYIELPFKISSAAGFDKNAQLSPLILKYFGFDRGVIGTITGEDWRGEKRPRIKRDAKNQSLFNKVSWENNGAELISKKVRLWEKYKFPTTISIGPTPNPQLNVEQRLQDLRKTIKIFRDIPYIDRFEYCPSCPNLKISREENQELLGEIISSIKQQISPQQELYIKISPDLTQKEIEKTIDDTYNFVKGYVTTNTTIRHNFGFGAGSGEILYSFSLATQKIFYDILKNTDKEIIACGGINSPERVEERRKYGANEIQLLAPVTFSLKLLRELRAYNYMKSF